MEHRKSMTSDLTTIVSNNNNNSHYHHRHHNRRKKRTAKQQQLVSLLPSKKTQVKSVCYIDPNSNRENISLSHQLPLTQQQQISMRNPLSWKKRWTKWFSSCGSERISQVTSNPVTVSIKVRYYLFFFCVFTDYTCCV
jgi:hypothetical protein